MLKVSTNEEFKRLIAVIVQEGEDFLSPIKELGDPYDFYKVYEKIIELASDNLKVEINDKNVPFFMKFDLVTISINLVNDTDYADEFMNKLCSISFDDLDSKLLGEIKNDANVITEVASLGCILNHFTLPYNLLSYLHQNIGNVPIQRYEKVIHNISILLESLSSIIQEKLYNDKSGLLNPEVTQFTLQSMQTEDSKKENTEVFKRLSVEYPEILKTYEQAISTLKRLQTRRSILI